MEKNYVVIKSEKIYRFHNNLKMAACQSLKYWAAQPNDPLGIRVASVIEFSVCLSVLSVFSLGMLQIF